eukprot:5003741-Pleurochrysis_carterae.AAC.1
MSPHHVRPHITLSLLFTRPCTHPELKQLSCSTRIRPLVRPTLAVDAPAAPQRLLRWRALLSRVHPNASALVCRRRDLDRLCIGYR